MRLQIESGPWNEHPNEFEAVLQLQSILLAAVEGTRGGDIDREYQAIRRALMADPELRKLTPSFVRANNDLVSLWPYFKSYNPQWGPRREMVRQELSKILDETERLSHAEIETPPNDAAKWTGIQSAGERLVAIKTLVPVAQASIETLIATLEAPNHNGGPPLDEHKEAIENLRELHKGLGELLEMVNDGQFDNSTGPGLLTEISNYGKRAARELRNDPLPYAASGLLLSLLTVLGAPGIAAYMTGIALNIRKTKP